MEAPALHTEISSSFAGALAAFASDAARLDPVSLDDGLADDIAVLSYENAVRTPPSFDSADAAMHTEDHANQPESLDRKSASITIRMSRAECAQLRKRAAAASLSVSAYMRSCILEAETLRAQVRQALAELRAATPDAPQLAEKQSPRRWWQPWPHFGARSN
jgi:hypothetical protein